MSTDPKAISEKVDRLFRLRGPSVRFEIATKQKVKAISEKVDRLCRFEIATKQKVKALKAIQRKAETL